VWIVDNGLKFYDLDNGTGVEVQKGDKVTVRPRLGHASTSPQVWDIDRNIDSRYQGTHCNVQVHFDCYIGVVDAVSSRYSALLGKNEIIPEV
jgi:hypothetical protein